MNIALDTETFYSKDFSVKDLGPWRYTTDSRFECYLITAAYEDGRSWAGNPKDFDWESVDGHSWVMANAGFDLAVIKTLNPNVAPVEVFDILDLARYLGYPGNLEAAAEHLLGQKLDKGTRNKAKGLHWHEFTPEFQKEMVSYALRDAQATLGIWLRHGKQWPSWEVELSKMTREMCETGVPIDMPRLEESIRKLKTTIWETETSVPWMKDEYPRLPEKKKELEPTVLSNRYFAEECRRVGIPPPATKAKNAPEWEIWLSKYGTTAPWAYTIPDYRSQNMLLEKLFTMQTRTRADGILPYGLKYGGAHTLRDSGDAGFNIQNLPKKPMHGVDLRSLIYAPEGFIFGICDLRGIEPCVLALLSGDTELVERLLRGEDTYEAWARMTHGYTDPGPLKEVNFALRQLCKVEILGLGYGAGVEKYMTMPKLLGIEGVEFTYEEAAESVKNFRARKYIPGLWESLEGDMRQSGGEDYHMELPSGRVMRYREVKVEHGVSALIPRGGKMMRLSFWGGSLTENLVQSTSRDIFMDGVLNLSDAGLPPCIRVHDEAVCLLPEETAESDLKTMQACMSRVPDWIPGLPLFTEGKLSKRYTK